MFLSSKLSRKFLFQDVFTVSVGNLPPKAKVLIKITYITELSMQGSVAVFFLPTTVAPWQQDKALNEHLQVGALSITSEGALLEGTYAQGRGTMGSSQGQSICLACVRTLSLVPSTEKNERERENKNI
jgi:hypothetical protein